MEETKYEQGSRTKAGLTVANKNNSFCRMIQWKTQVEWKMQVEKECKSVGLEKEDAMN